MSRISVEGRIPDESPELQAVLREVAQEVNVLAGRIFVGTGTPEGVVVAATGSIYLNTSGGAGVSMYVKESNSGASTGWAAK